MRVDQSGSVCRVRDYHARQNFRDRASRHPEDAEVVDPRTLVPLDEDTILESVAKTHYLVIVDECHRRCGVGAEFAALVVEKAFSDLRAPIVRVSTEDVPVPFSQTLERYIEPTEDKVVQAVLRVLS